jgi:hypothetical protein
MRFILAAVLFVSLAGCGSGSMPPSPASPTTSPTPSSEPATYVVSGTVLETAGGISRPVASQYLALYIWETEGLPPGMRLRGTTQETHTDQNGRYEIRVPKSRVFVSAVWGKRQPCVASASVDKDTTIDVETVPSGSVFTPPTAATPLITGFVYEITPEGRRPVRGASAWLDLGLETYVANAETDESGHFFFCRVNTRAALSLWAQGYQPDQHEELVTGTGDMSFEFEVRR